MSACTFSCNTDLGIQKNVLFLLKKINKNQKYLSRVIIYQKIYSVSMLLHWIHPLFKILRYLQYLLWWWQLEELIPPPHSLNTRFAQLTHQRLYASLLLGTDPDTDILTDTRGSEGNGTGWLNKLGYNLFSLYHVEWLIIRDWINN